MAPTVRVQGSSRPGRWDCKGRAEFSPLREAGVATPVVVQDTKVLAVVARGAEALCAMGSGRAAISLIGMHRRNGAPAGQRVIACVQCPQPAGRIPARACPQGRIAASGMPSGGPRGTGESPRQGARGSTTHTLYKTLSGISLLSPIIAEAAGTEEICTGL